MDVIFALSTSGLIEKYGAYAGILAIPGLAVLSLLYFAQAREVRRLRELAEAREHERPAATGAYVQPTGARDPVSVVRRQPPPGRAPGAGRPAAGAGAAGAAAGAGAGA